MVPFTGSAFWELPSVGLRQCRCRLFFSLVEKLTSGPGRPILVELLIDQDHRFILSQQDSWIGSLRFGERPTLGAILVVNKKFGYFLLAHPRKRVADDSAIGHRTHCSRPQYIHLYSMFWGTKSQWVSGTAPVNL